MRENGIRELLVRRGWFATKLTGRIDLVLRLDSVDDFSDRDVQFRQLVRFHPQPHGIVPRAEYLRLADAIRARDRIVEVNRGVVGQELLIVSAMRRK